MEGKSRHLFADAITPKGLINYIDTLIEPSMKVYAIEGMPGSGAKEALQTIAIYAEKLGYDIEQLHSPFEPEMLNMVILPTIQVVIIYTTEFSINFKESHEELEQYYTRTMNFDYIELKKQYVLNEINRRTKI